jgi:peptidoglycan/LPS O-acetylase OafA/YrhL
MIRICPDAYLKFRNSVIFKDSNSNYRIIHLIKGESQMRNNEGYREDIQVLRGITVISIILFHASKSLFPLGYLGVDVFFVISGFVISPLIFRIFSSQGDEKYNPLTNLREFLVLRYFRLAPALAVSLIVSSILIFLLGPVSDHSRFAKQGIASLLLLGNLGAVRYSGDYFSPNPNPLVHTWSLSIEEQVYILLPVILFFVTRKVNPAKKVFFAVFLIITSVSLILFLFPAILLPIYSKLGIVYSTTSSFYFLSARIWEITIGGLLFIATNKLQNSRFRLVKFVNISLIIIFFMALFGQFELDQSVSTVFVVLLSLGIITLRTLTILPKQMQEIFGWIGNRSYSIYLYHMPLIYLAKASPLVEFDSTDSRVFQVIIAVLLSMLLGAVSYSVIEVKYRREKNTSSNSLSKVSISLIYTVLVPLTFLITLYVGFETNYWGMEKRNSIPPFAGQVESKCKIDLEPTCTYKNSNAKKTVLLIGDSQAESISRALVLASKNAKWNAVILSHNGCLVQFEQSNSLKLNDACLSANNEMLKWVFDNRPDAIIVSQLMRFNASQKEITSSINRLKVIVPEILIIENIPIFPDGGSFMVRNPLFMKFYDPPISFRESQMFERDKHASDILGEWARRNGLTTLNFHDLFCQNEICKRYLNGLWLYRDAEHLSIDGALLTVPHLEKYLKSR